MDFPESLKEAIYQHAEGQYLKRYRRFFCECEYYFFCTVVNIVSI